MNYHVPNFRNLSMNITKEAIEFLCGTTKKRKNVCYFFQILARMKLVDTQRTRHGVTYTVKAGQADLPILSLAKRWGMGRKACKSFLRQMEEVKLIRIRSDRTKPVIDVICVGGWFGTDGSRASNPYYIFARSQPQSATPPKLEKPT